MDRKELLTALEELEDRLDIAQIDDDAYTTLRDAVGRLKTLIGLRQL